MPADCTAQISEAVLVGEPHSPRVENWPEVIAADRAAFAETRRQRRESTRPAFPVFADAAYVAAITTATAAYDAETPAAVAHSVAEQFKDADTDALEEVWINLRDEYEFALDKILKLPAATPEFAALKVQAFVAGHGNTIDRDGEIGGPMMFGPEREMAFTSLWRDVQGFCQAAPERRGRSSGFGNKLRPRQDQQRPGPWVIEPVILIDDCSTTHPLAPLRGDAEWDDAAFRYNECCEAADEIYRQYVKADAALISLSPEELLGRVGAGIRPRWDRESHLDADRNLTKENREFLRPFVRSWERDLPRFTDELNIKELAERNEIALDQVFEVIELIQSVAAPDAIALAFKQRLAMWDYDDAKMGFDDLGFVAFTRHCDAAGYSAVLTHIDTLRIAGLDHPVLHMEDFNPRAWITEFEQCGGVVSSPEYDALSIQQLHAGGPTRVQRMRKMQAELTTEWKHRAVFLAAQQRREYGGDPLVTAALERRKRGA